MPVLESAVDDMTIDNFKGTRKQYIEYLETIVHRYRSTQSPTNAQPTTLTKSAGQLGNQPSLAQTPWISYQHNYINHTPPEKDAIDRYLSRIPPASKWKDSRKKSGLLTAEQNTWAIRFLVNDPRLLDESLPSEWKPFRVPSTRWVDLPTRELECAKSYIERIKDFRSESKLINTVLKLLDLVFVQWGALMIKRGRYTVEEVDELTKIRFGDIGTKSARRYRYGGNWISRVSSGLCRAGWGKRSFDLIAVNATSAATYAWFADSMVKTTERVLNHLKREEYWKTGEDDEDKWITFCSPCILKCLSNDRLEDICEDLDFDETAIEVIKDIWETDYKELYDGLQRARNDAARSARRLERDAEHGQSNLDGVLRAGEGRQSEGVQLREAGEGVYDQSSGFTGDETSATSPDIHTGGTSCTVDSDFECCAVSQEGEETRKRGKPVEEDGKASSNGNCSSQATLAIEERPPKRPRISQEGERDKEVRNPNGRTADSWGAAGGDLGEPSNVSDSGQDPGATSLGQDKPVEEVEGDDLASDSAGAGDSRDSLDHNTLYSSPSTQPLQAEGNSGDSQASLTRDKPDQVQPDQPEKGPPYTRRRSSSLPTAQQYCIGSHADETENINSEPLREDSSPNYGSLFGEAAEGWNLFDSATLAV